MPAHRTPKALADWLQGSAARGSRTIIAAAGGAAQRAGVAGAHTVPPVLGVPMPSKHLQGLDSPRSTAQMPKGVPVATLASG